MNDVRDLVERLRKNDARAQFTSTQKPPFSIQGEAADEIERLRAARPEVDANLAAEINRVWIHGCCQGHGEPVDDVATLTKRVRWIGSQLDCAQTNFRVTNAAYCKLDEETRALRSPQKTMEKS